MRARTTVTPFPSSKRFDSDIARKGTLCASVLAEGRRLADQRKFGPPLFELVARACDLLDDIDEILVALDPERNAESFADNRLGPVARARTLFPSFAGAVTSFQLLRPRCLRLRWAQRQ